MRATGESREVRGVGAAAVACMALALASPVAAGPRPASERAVIAPSEVRVAGDGIPAALSAEPGDPARGRALLVAREAANCVLCHPVPDPAIRFAGNLGPSLAGVGARLTAGELRLRIVDSERLNPSTIMPSYYRIEGLRNVARQYRGQPILTAQEIEDIVAYLGTLR